MQFASTTHWYQSSRYTLHPFQRALCPSEALMCPLQNQHGSIPRPTNLNMQLTLENCLGSEEWKLNWLNCFRRYTDCGTRLVLISKMRGVVRRYYFVPYSLCKPWWEHWLVRLPSIACILSFLLTNSPSMTRHLTRYKNLKLCKQFTVISIQKGATGR